MPKLTRKYLMVLLNLSFIRFIIIDTSKDLVFKYHHEDKVKMSQSGAEAMKHYINVRLCPKQNPYKTFPNWDVNLKRRAPAIAVNCQFGNPTTTKQQC